MQTGLIAFIEYLEQLAAKNVDIAHDAATHPAFHLFYDAENADSAIRNRITNVPCILVKDYDFAFADGRSDNVHKVREIEFIVVDKLGRNASMDDVYQVWERTEAIGDEFIVKMKADKRKQAHPAIINFSIDGVRGVPVDLQVSNLHGTSYTVRVSSVRSNDPDPDKWNEE